MLASASIPVAFPPVFFDVEVDGIRYDEMHVDGGVGARVFLPAGLFSSNIVRERGGRGKGREDIFVIHNGQLIPAPEPVRRSLPAIATRVIDASGRAAVKGDLLRIYGAAMQQQASFRWVTIPDDVSMDSDEVFDPVQMSKLYEIGYGMAVAGGAWAKVPPGLLGAPQ
jgi:predicted acylesterase/phospholipase RssA